VLALIDDLNALGVMRVCDVDVEALRESLARYIDNDLKTLVIDDGHKSKLTAALSAWCSAPCYMPRG
jgi:ATP-dependent Clp protease ATP-binding subunit ClpA